MRADLLPILRCAACRSESTLALHADAEDDREVREGRLDCAACGARWAVGEGIVHLLGERPAHVDREAAGLERFAEVMRADGWDVERILRLPDEPSGYWDVQKVAMAQILREADLRPGERIVDLGANTCWASNAFAERGLDVVALDIALTDLQGLRTAEHWMRARGTYFERVLGSMTDLPFAAASVDRVFACQVLHHNDRAELAAAFREAHRVLRPGGSLLVINEPLRTPLRPALGHGDEVEAFEGHEHVYFAFEYIRAARAAGFAVELLPPPTVRILTPPMLDLGPRSTPREIFGLGWRYLARRAIRRPYAAWLVHVRGGVGLNLICRRP